MITVGCAGFAVPATRYFKESAFVEIQETHLAKPGPGTLRRWRREAPDGFRFAMLGPKQISQDAFRPGAATTEALAELAEVGGELAATTVVFVAGTDFDASAPNRASLEEFLQTARQRFEEVVFEPGPLWDPAEADSLAEATNTLAARDPLKHGLSPRQRAYYRLPGPAGYKSRYEDPAIEQLAEIADQEQDATYVFANVDMFTDAKRFQLALSR